MSSPALGRPITVGEYYRMAETGGIPPDQRVELIDGEVVEMSPIGSRHAVVVDRLTRSFVLAVGDGAVVRVQNPVRLTETSELQPDLALLRPGLERYWDRHPGPRDILLIVEVSDTTVGKDRHVKRPLYAAAGVPEVWIVDLERGVVEVATDPGRGGYRSVRQAGRDDTVCPAALPGVAVPAADILP